MRAAALALLLVAPSLPLAAAEPAQQVQLRSAPAQASRCITQRAQNQRHYTKTTDPAKGEQQIVVYEGASAGDSQEVGTITVTQSGNSARATIDARGEKARGRELLAGLANGC